MHAIAVVLASWSPAQIILNPLQLSTSLFSCPAIRERTYLVPQFINNSRSVLLRYHVRSHYSGPTKILKSLNFQLHLYWDAVHANDSASPPRCRHATSRTGRVTPTFANNHGRPKPTTTAQRTTRKENDKLANDDPTTTTAWQQQPNQRNRRPVPTTINDERPQHSMSAHDERSQQSTTSTHNN
ncbi:uncharacterized protein LACBIDRAFT_333645 [Laccaria bicolor S238N-H82]|uniref:Predicted protein n=1 Tax=Laccaria bicolor (strain S238N-H82 / ATCC MYA-4686) TaxID=486041 RepID=B0DWR8_LACBS|nr:uncharacterized protein LACBIDRAFT_333645 [Laccaria bicolor S238N-H82]EDR00943.1 predicted protein [Laccaria bicolor S238N-H82]|eukprot:XP_001888338.1 predicted protein [Laccaria bicolor S238N-H82]